jgi:SAM-dependent methyltransferase
MSGDEDSLREAWQGSASEWILWARSPRLDHVFWRMNLPALLSLLPAPEGLTLDVGCGEGRLARMLKRNGGYEVIGIDASETLAAAAREADPSFDVRTADAAAMPFPDNQFDLAVASLSLMNMDDMPGVLGEIARVLRPEGHLCLSVLHPLNSWRHTGENGYFQLVRYSETIGDGEEQLTLHDTHRSLRSYFDAFEQAGFLTERVLEPVPDEAHVADFPAIASWREQPTFLHIRAVLGAPADRQALWQPDRRFEPLPAYLRDLVDLVLGDLQGSKPVSLRVGWDPTQVFDRDGDGHHMEPTPMLRFSEPAFGGGVGWTPEAPGTPAANDSEGADADADTFAELAVRLADYLQEQFFWESGAAWAEPRPECPDHRHPAVPALIDGEAWWVCPEGGPQIARFGQLR